MLIPRFRSILWQPLRMWAARFCWSEDVGKRNFPARFAPILYFGVQFVNHWHTFVTTMDSVLFYPIYYLDYRILFSLAYSSLSHTLLSRILFSLAYSSLSHTLLHTYPISLHDSSLSTYDYCFQTPIVASLLVLYLFYLHSLAILKSRHLSI
jgi:hypothetical protein